MSRDYYHYTYDENEANAKAVERAIDKLNNIKQDLSALQYSKLFGQLNVVLSSDEDDIDTKQGLLNRLKQIEDEVQYIIDHILQ